MTNNFELKIKAISENEAFVRNLVASFAVGLNPTIDEITDIKTAVSEAITNCIVHAYKDSDNENDYITVRCSICDGRLEIMISDEGIGIADVAQAKTPFYTTGGFDERSGMGFTLMETFMDEMSVESVLNRGTTVTLVKYISCDKEILNVGA